VGKSYLIYGTGSLASEIYSQYSNKLSILGFVETFKSANEFIGLPVYDSEELITFSRLNDCFFILTSKNPYSCSAMMNNLMEIGVKKEKIILDYIDDKNIYHLYPKINDKELFDELCFKFNWFLPCNSNINAEVHIYSDSIEEGIIGNIYIHNKNIELNNSFKYLVWDVEQISQLTELKCKLYIIDKNYKKDVDILSWMKMFYESLSIKSKFNIKEHSIENFRNLSRKDYKESWIFTTGPSLGRYKEFDYNKNDFKLICNNIILDDEFLNHVYPTAITIADIPVFFSECEYGINYRNKLYDNLVKYKIYCIVPEHIAYLMVTNNPSIINYVIGVPVKNEQVPNIVDNNNFYITPADNIATILLMPIASGQTDTIKLIGMDGKSLKNEKLKKSSHIWNHYEQIEYDFSSIKKSYPAYFSNIDKEQYYDKHEEDLEKVLTYGERFGKKYISKTFSNYEPLKKRMED